MTYEEALQEVEEHCFWSDECRVDSSSKNLIIEALGKQIKKKPLNVTYDDGYLEYWNCPNCHIQHSEELKVFCDVCGQAIDWS